MGSEWLEVPFNELGEVNRGKSRHRPRYAVHLYGGPYPFIQTGDIRGSNGRIVSHSQTYSEEGLAQSRIWPSGTMCITIAANIAETAILTYPACFPDSVVGFIADEEKCDVQFVEYSFRLFKKRLQSEAIGSVQDNINLGTLSRLNIHLPALPEQKAIAHVLGSLDDKIGLNRQMNETLEAMAQALFKSWFVDFDPVIDNALAAGNPIPDALKDKAEQRQQLRDAEAGQNNAPASAHHAHFPNAFEFHEDMGWIPEGWEVCTLAEVTSVIIDHRGKTPKKLGGDWSESGYPAISAKNIKDNKLVRHDSIRFVDKEIYEKWMKVPLEKGDVAMTSEAPLGELYYFNSKIDYLLSQRLYGLRADKSKSSGAFLFHWLQSNIGASDLQNRATGTTVTGIRQSELRKVVILSPTSAILNKFDGFTNVYLEKIDSNDNSNLVLSKLRDTLLPKLLSGELRIPDAEKLIAESIS